MHVEPIVNALRAAVLDHTAIVGLDPPVEAATAQIIEALGPALRLAVLDLAAQAAAEIDAQLPDQRVEVVLVDGDPMLRVSESAPGGERAVKPEELDARITLRLPPSLKLLIEDAADRTGESVNGWVMEALDKRARRPPRDGRRVTESFDL